MQMGVDHFDGMDHDRISAEVRIRLAARLDRMLDLLEPLVDPEHPSNMGEVSPAMVQAYVGVVKTMGSLYQVQNRPETNTVPAEKVARMLEEARMVSAAEAVAQERGRLVLEGRKTVEEARTALSAKLDEMLAKSGPSTSAGTDEA